MNMRGFWFGLAVGTVSTCLFGQWVLTAVSKEVDPERCIPPRTVTDYVHSVIQADRTFYTTDIVERMQVRGIVVASENWRETAKLPLPAQFLIEAATGGPGKKRTAIYVNQPLGDQSKEPAYDRLRASRLDGNPCESRYPPYRRHAAEGISVFQALYADKAVSQSCVGCHNAHPNSRKRDFKAGM